MTSSGPPNEPAHDDDTEGGAPRLGPRKKDSRPIVWMIAFLVVALIVYFVLLGWRGFQLIASGSAAGIGLGLGGMHCTRGCFGSIVGPGDAVAHPDRDAERQGDRRQPELQGAPRVPVLVHRERLPIRLRQR